MIKPLISVIVSTYNSEEFMKECLDDLVGQTIFNRMEVIVVDAASPQNEKGVVDNYLKKHSNITYIRTDRRIGIYAAWNAAIKTSSGEYVMTFSTNDRLRDEACEKLAFALDDHPDVMLVYGDTYLTDKPHQSFDLHNRTGRYEWPEYTYEDLLQNCRVGPHPVWRRSVHDDIGYFDETYVGLGDYEFWLRLGEKYRLLHVPFFTGLFWMDDESLSLNRNNSEREISRCREIYQRRYMKRLECADDDYSRELSFISQGIFNDRARIILDSGHGTDDIFRQYYDGTKARTYIHKEDLQWFFDINFVDSEWLYSCIAELYDMVCISLDEVQDMDGQTLTALKSFIRAFGRGMQSKPHRYKRRRLSLGEYLDHILKDILKDSSNVSERPYEFNRNFLIPEFMRHLEQCGMYLCNKMSVLTGNETYFAECISGIFAMIAGEALGSFYLYSKSLNRLTPDLIRVDKTINNRACCYED